MTEQLTVYDRWDQFMRLLSAQPRRQIVVSLMEEPDRSLLSLPEAATTPGLPVDRERFEIRLRQIHVPMLADAEYVRWTEGPLRVGRGERFDEPAAVMDLLLEGDDRLPPALTSGCVEEST